MVNIQWDLDDCWFVGVSAVTLNQKWLRIVSTLRSTIDKYRTDVRRNKWKCPRVSYLFFCSFYRRESPIRNNSIARSSLFTLWKVRFFRCSFPFSSSWMLTRLWSRRLERQWSVWVLLNERFIIERRTRYVGRGRKRGGGGVRGKKGKELGQGSYTFDSSPSSHAWDIYRWENNATK